MRDDDDGNSTAKQNAWHKAESRARKIEDGSPLVPYELLFFQHLPTRSRCVIAMFPVSKSK